MQQRTIVAPLTSNEHVHNIPLLQGRIKKIALVGTHMQISKFNTYIYNLLK